MTVVQVYRFPGDGIDNAALRKLLGQCGLVEASKHDKITAAIPLVIILTPELLAHEELERVLIEATSMGRRIICIWPDDENAVAAPVCVDKYSAAQVPWDGEKVKRALSDDEEPIYETAKGTTQTRSVTQPNKC